MPSIDPRDLAKLNEMLDKAARVIGEAQADKPRSWFIVQAQDLCRNESEDYAVGVLLAMNETLKAAGHPAATLGEIIWKPSK